MRDVIGAADKIAFQRQHCFQPLALAHHLLRFFRIRPQIRIRRLLFDFGKLLAQLTRVKDTPAGRVPWSSRSVLLFEFIQHCLIAYCFLLVDFFCSYQPCEQTRTMSFSDKAHEQRPKEIIAHSYANQSPCRV